ncbi:hypothetical protein EK21DRAFT_104972 [Setomelanomma holmii]|uniref:Uncharacterized protein n=1 Tax=Setomelanomma holmii TaxID=210430 RepID=A0A9P4LG64_9PLEO|nr:hypothetical protein EK21DRAFT_104972 [Setomelanomma holmii]
MPSSSIVLEPDHDASKTPSPAAIPSLPTLTEKPTAYPGCCLGLSTPLLAHFRTLLPQAPALILSIGSGFGLLEAYLLELPPSVNVAGVEVEPSPNKYLPPSNHRIVHGTRFLEPLAKDAATWLFVYPRRVGLVMEYLDTHGEGALQTIVWVGPHADWSDYEHCFAGWKTQMTSADQVGGRAWELIAVARKPG